MGSCHEPGSMEAALLVLARVTSTLQHCGAKGLP